MQMKPGEFKKIKDDEYQKMDAHLEEIEKLPAPDVLLKQFGERIASRLCYRDNEYSLVCLRQLTNFCLSMERQVRGERKEVGGG